MFNPEETQYEVLRRRGICRRDFLKFCSMAAVALGLGPMGHLEIAHAMETKPYLPVLWINGLSCSCCTESFIRSAHPLASDIILSMIALDYQDTIMAAAGDQAMECFEEAISTYKGRYILAVEGNPPLGEEGMYCIDGGRPFMDKLQRGAAGAKAIVAGGPAPHGDACRLPAPIRLRRPLSTKSFTTSRSSKSRAALPSRTS
ncbi:hypothetical protein HMPREF0178_00357 [Bilophila sp. 4_1_30]|nr:hypothetical protein HMPREF0178_00357 [Bilophila sp. 4_1_30]